MFRTGSPIALLNGRGHVGIESEVDRFIKIGTARPALGLTEQQVMLEPRGEVPLLHRPGHIRMLSEIVAFIVNPVNVGQVQFCTEYFSNYSIRHSLRSFLPPEL